MQDLNYFPLDFESNIYGMTTLEFNDRTSKVLVATLNCQIYCINYNKFKPHTREVEFTYIPNGAKIISIGALKRGPNDFVIGITHSLAPGDQKGSTRTNSSFPSREAGEFGRMTTYYFNIYGSGSANSSFDLDYVAQGCQTIRLRYVPYHLYQTELISFLGSTTKSTQRKPFWLLSGGDSSIHAYCEDKPYQSFNEIPIEECFPELNHLPSIGLWMDVLNFDDGSGKHERAIVLGFEDGSVRLYHSVLSDLTRKFELIRESSFDNYTTIIPSVRLFKVSSTYSSKVSRLSKLGEARQDHQQDKNLQQLNILAVSSTESSIIFEDVLTNGLDLRYDLPNSRRLDCAVTSAIGDTNFDGHNEVLIGTHGCELLTYQFDKKGKRYHLAGISEFNHPLFAISILDLTGDALEDVIILLASGVLVMQAAVKDVIAVCRQRVERLIRKTQFLRSNA